MSAEALIPHQPPMRLLDEVLAHNERNPWAHTEVARQSPFASDCGVRACVGLEYLAQAAAAFFTLQDDDGDSPRQGMLIACRRFTTAQAFFPPASHLLLKVSLTSPLPPNPGASALVKFKGEIHVLQPNTAMPTSAAECVRVAAAEAITLADLSVYL